MLSFLWVIFVFILGFQAYKYFSKNYKMQKELEKIPAPLSKPLIGHLHLFMVNPDSLFQMLRDFSEKYGPIYRMSTFYVTIVHFLDPADIEIILSSTKHLTKSKVYTFLHNWLGTGLLTSTGTKWHTRRKILTPTFHFSILQQFLNIFNDETAKLVEKLQTEKNDIINVVPPVTHFTLQSILETAMGLSSIDEIVQKQYKEAIYQIGRIFLRRLGKPWYRINSIYKMSKLGKEEDKTVKILHKFSEHIIKTREQDQVLTYSKRKRLAMLDLLLSAKKDGADIDFEGIREEVDTFMFEGHDTTSMALSFILLMFANLQEIQSKVLDEILQVLGPSKVPTSNDLQELKYTERCIKETLRLFPSVPFISRYASEDFTTKTGYFIPKGTVLHIHIFDLHRNPRYYPDPLKFDPDRFLPENVATRHPFAYIPFSAGPRNCIGQKFAMMELKTAVCGILRKFQLKKVDDMYDIEFRPDLVLRPKTDIKVKIFPRNL